MGTVRGEGSHRVTAWGSSTLFLAAAIGVGVCERAAAGPSRALRPDTLAWWTFDNHLRDEVHGLELKNVPNAGAQTEAFYVSIQYLTEVPILEIGGHPNGRAYYRWGIPNVTQGRLGDELDPAGAFTIETYLKPRSDTFLMKQARAFVLRKVRGDNKADRQMQWLVEIRRRPGQTRLQGDLCASVTFLMLGGKTVTREVLATDALRMGYWQRVAVVYDGKTLSLWVDGKPAASADGPGPGARVLPSKGTSWLYVSDNHVQLDGTPTPKDKPHDTIHYAGRYDELRITGAALGGDQLLPPVQVLTKEPLPDPPKRTEYTSIARRHLDLLMKHGTDRYGPVHSPLLASTLDPKTLKMVEIKPAVIQGMPEPHGPYRSPLWGCNLDLMRNTLMAMRTLSGTSGEARYAQHADRALRFYFDHCLYPSGVWPLGEHGVWNFHTDKPQPTRPDEPGAHLDYERYYKIAPKKVARYIDLMHKIHMFKYTYKGKELWFHGRHGSEKGNAHGVGGCGFPRHSGLFARAWVFLYTKTKNPKYLQWAKDQVDLMWEMRDPRTHLVPGQMFPPPGSTMGGRTYSKRIYATTSTIYACLAMLDAVEWLDDPADKKLFFDRAYTMAMANINVYARWNGKAFTLVRPSFMGHGPRVPGLAFLVLKVWERSGRPAPLLAYARRVADATLAQWRPTKNTSAGCFGWQIMFLVQMHNETGDQRYLDFARRLGDYAAANLVFDNGLVVGSGYYRIYDRMYHVPKLIQALVALDHPKHPAVKPLLREALF